MKWLFLKRFEITLHWECRIRVFVKRIIFNMYTRNARYYVTMPQHGIVQFAKWSRKTATILRNDRVTRAIFMKRPKENVKTLVVLLLLHKRNGQISFAIVNSRIVSNATDASTNFILSALLYRVLLYFYYVSYLKYIWRVV